MDGTMASQEFRSGSSALAAVPKASARDTLQDGFPFCRSIVRNFRRGEVVGIAGLRTDKFARVHKGLVSASTMLADGREFIVEFIPQNGFIGELEILRRQPLTLEYRAALDCELHFFEGRHLRALCASDSAFQEKLLSKALARVGELESRLISNAGSSLQSRLANTILRLAGNFSGDGDGDELMISQQDLAATLPASREKVNQCLRRMRESKIIGGTQGTIRILNRKALRECAASTTVLK